MAKPVLQQPWGNVAREIMLARHDPEQLLAGVLDALAKAPQSRELLNDLPVPVYMTDAKGAVTYWNSACVEFAGREPEPGRDQWCINCQMFTTTGEPLQAENCPMAVAVKTRRPIRDAITIAERPDGSRIAYRPYPTPLFEDGELSGAINILIDVTAEQRQALHDQAEQCRRLADATYDREISKSLAAMADRFERTLEGLKRP